jgi:hypothetical protein
MSPKKTGSRRKSASPAKSAGPNPDRQRKPAIPGRFTATPTIAINQPTPQPASGNVPIWVKGTTTVTDMMKPVTAMSYQVNSGAPVVINQPFDNWSFQLQAADCPTSNVQNLVIVYAWNKDGVNYKSFQFTRTN